jgi:hypothetical protein
MGSGNGQHPYHLCRDPDCERYACVAWKQGYADGFADGFADGYGAGFAAGLASCPGPHGGE